MNCRLIVAESQSEKEAAFRLRYDAFFLEAGDGRYADHESRFWCDSDDRDGALILNAVDAEEQWAGTIRLTPRRRFDYIACDLYREEILVDILGMPLEVLYRTLARVDRAAVRKDCRRRGVFDALLCGVERIAREEGCGLLVANPHASNVASISGLERRGFTKYAIGVYGAFSAQLMFKVLVT